MQDSDIDAQHRDPDVDVEFRQFIMSDPSIRCDLYSSSSSRNSILPRMIRCRDDADPDWPDTRKDRAAAHEPQLQPDRPHLRAEPGAFQNGSFSNGPLGLSGWWMRSNQHYDFDETFHNLLDTLDIEQNHTYVTIGNEECVKGIMPVLTSPVISRRVILTRNIVIHWCAMDITNVPGNNYNFGYSMNYVVLYKFTSDFSDYMVDVAFEQETTLAKTSKTELSNSLDDILGDLSTYWTLWETNPEPDNIVDILQTKNDALVKLYSPPRIVEAAVTRGLRANLSIDLSTDYDLSLAQGRQHVKDEIRRRKPKLLVTSPPCTKFSQF